MGAYASNFNKAVAVLPRTLVNFLQVPLHDPPLKPNCSCCYFRDKKLQQAAEHNKAGFAVQYVVTTNGLFIFNSSMLCSVTDGKDVEGALCPSAN